MPTEPWFKFWAVEYLCDGKVDKVPPEGRELLVRMWCICSQEGCVSADIEELARVTRLKTQYVSQYVSQCVTFFELRNGMYISLRMEREKQKSEAARKSAEARYNSETYKKEAAKRTAERIAKKARKQESKKEDQELKKEQNQTPTPSATAESGLCEVIPVTPEPHIEREPPTKKHARRTRTEIFSKYSAQVVDMTNEVLDAWPTKRSNGTHVEANPALLASRLDDLLKDSRITRELLSACHTRYLAEHSVFAMAPQYFFGDKRGDKNTWEIYARMIHHENAAEKSAGAQ